MVNLGHVVFYVRNLNASLDYYQRVVGLEPKGKIFGGRAVMLTGGSTHHELLLIEVGDAPGPLQNRRIGLYHVGWKIGDSIDELRLVFEHLKKTGIEIDGISDHTISQSIYLRDPDGNELELYVDNPDIDWRVDQSWMETPVKPLHW
jgi:catechol 2,3-dioxygenase